MSNLVKLLRIKKILKEKDLIEYVQVLIEIEEEYQE
tara:strand:+ start:622 stop:729 length:108 start_codon:yes stop_codon:yes gene_type:complete